MTCSHVALLGLVVPLTAMQPTQSLPHALWGWGHARRAEAVVGPGALAAGSGVENGNAGKKAQKFWVKLTPAQAEPKHQRLTQTLDLASRQAIGGIPGVTVLQDSDDENAFARKHRQPVIVFSGKLQGLAESKDGEELVFRAEVQYIVYRLPGRNVAAVVSGAAQARVYPAQIRTKQSRQQLEDKVVSAAVESAARRAPPALEAAAKHS
jgi:hypothetical protein